MKITDDKIRVISKKVCLRFTASDSNVVLKFYKENKDHEAQLIHEIPFDSEILIQEFIFNSRTLWSITGAGIEVEPIDIWEGLFNGAGIIK